MKLVTWAATLLILACAEVVGAQDYPIKPIRLVVPFPPGGAGEFVAGTVARKLTESVKQPIVVDYRAGGARGTAVGTELVAKAEPDGYSLLLAPAGAMSIYPALHTKPSYDAFRDFAPIGMVAFLHQILVVNASLPVNSVNELVALAQSRPRQLYYGSTGTGTGTHLAIEWIKVARGIDMTHVPFDGAAQRVQALLAGKVSVAFSTGPAVLPHVKSGKLRAIAVASPRRSPDLPDIPTVAESGVPGFEYVAWFGLFAPARTPRQVVQKLNGELVKTLGDPETVRQLASRGGEASPTTPEALAKNMREDYERWKKVIKTAGIKLN